MVSNDKRYRNTLQVVTRIIKEEISNSSTGYIQGNYASFFRMLYFDRSFYNAQLESPIEMNINNYVYEWISDGECVIGIDLSRSRFTEDEERRKIYRIASEIRRLLRYKQYIDEIEAEISPFRYDGYISGEDLKKTALFNRLLKEYDSIISSAKVSLKLNDGEFPKVKNRGMIPIGIIDIGKNSISLYKYDNPDSYRQGRFTNNLDTVIRDGRVSKYVVRIPIKLIQADVNWKHLV